MIELFVTISSKIGVSTSLLLAICGVESKFHNINNFNDPHGGSHGVCQINVKTAQMLLPYADKLALQQVSFNIEVSALYLKKLQKKYNNTNHIISAYNAGHVTINNGVYSNQLYVNKVLKEYNKYL